ncbi:54S ribosomal protein L3 mitochondrial [Diaporthe australafricana]|uniref:Large ribosomal subunit protein mL44 n=1 Tax=Diaporthe australafricana TaxID=127596 RepID=A0ABR3XV08_9PEZI
MKRLRLEKWSGHLLTARPGATSRNLSSQTRAQLPRPNQLASSPRCQSTAAARQIEAEIRQGPPEPTETISSDQFSSAAAAEPPLWPTISTQEPIGPVPSPLPRDALRSAKLAALHARLSLSDRIPVQTLARTLVDASADPAPLFNNINLAFLGQTLISYHTSELLMCRFPRLPMQILHSAMKTYSGDKTLYHVARSWGVESAAAPGMEVDPGLLQFSLEKDRTFNTKWGFARTETAWGPAKNERFRRGISSRVVLDDDFGDMNVDLRNSEPELDAEAEAGEDEMEIDLPEERKLTLGDPDVKMNRAYNIHGTFVRAVVGAIYTHCGRESARSFIKAHILSRHFDLQELFSFRQPTRELSRLCAREEFDPPVARLLSETGRLSRTPVFVVGIFSGNDKLGEGAAASLHHARLKAAMNALKAWYLYSPGEDVRVPSDMLVDGAKPWEPVYVDIGEVV